MNCGTSKIYEVAMAVVVVEDANTKVGSILLGLNNFLPNQSFGHLNKTCQSSYYAKCEIILLKNTN